MALNITKSIPLTHNATSIALVNHHVVTTTGMDDFSVLYDTQNIQHEPAGMIQLSGSSGRNKSLFAAGGTLVELMNAGNQALIMYAGVAVNLSFSFRQIQDIAVSSDGEHVAFVVADLSANLDLNYYEQVANLYILQLEPFFASVIAADESGQAPTLIGESKYGVNLGLKREDTSLLQAAGARQTVRTVYNASHNGQHKTLIFNLCSVTFVPNSNLLFLTGINQRILTALLVDDSGDLIHLEAFKSIQYTGTDNRSCSNGQFAYSVSSHRNELYGYDIENQTASCIEVMGKALIDVAVYKNQFYILAFNIEKEVFELLDKDMNLIYQNNSISELASSEDYLALLMDKTVQLLQ